MQPETSTTASCSESVAPITPPNTPTEHPHIRQGTPEFRRAVLALFMAGFATFGVLYCVQPLLPGVAQIDWVMHYATTLLAPGWRFHSIQNVKFQAPLLPENTVTLTLSWQEARQTLTFSYQRHDDDARHTASSGKIRLCR